MKIVTINRQQKPSFREMQIVDISSPVKKIQQILNDTVQGVQHFVRAYNAL
jgi:hypothetical protein